jgi:hypothetical protein
MKTRNAGMALLLMSAVFTAPAMAGGQHLSKSQIQALHEAASVHDTVIAMHMGSGSSFAQLEGMQVTGSRGQELGTIIAVDYGNQLAQVYMADEGMSVALPVRMLTAQGDHAMAPTVSKADALAMVTTQSHVTQFAGL